MDERSFYSESSTTKPITMNCPHCKTEDSYDLRWMVRLKKDRLPGRADEIDRAKFAKAQSYMVLVDDKVACKNLRCRRRFDVSGFKSKAFLRPEQETEARGQQKQSGAGGAGGRDTAGGAGGRRNRGRGEAVSGNREQPHAGQRRRKRGRGPQGRGRRPVR